MTAPGNGSSHVDRVPPRDLASVAFRDAWRNLALARSNPFLTPEWVDAWLATHPDEEPYVIRWTRGSDLAGVLPLVRVSKGPAKLLRLAGARRGDWFTPVCRAEDEAEMGAACAAFLHGERRVWHAIRLDRIDSRCGWPHALSPAGGSLAPARAWRRDVLPYVELGAGGYAAYLAGRSRNFRSQLGRRRRRLERDHGLTFRMTETEADLCTDIETFFRLHDERWRARGGSSSSAPDVREHHRRFAAAALARGWLRLWIAEADGEPAAAWYGWRIGERYCYSLSGLRERYESLALGNVLLAHTIEQAAEEGATTYDLMWGDEDYKRRFETGRREATTWIVTRRRHPARLGVGLAGGAVAGAKRLPPGTLERAQRLRRAVSRS